jgi:pimeloyl-ACP methyl ester carboxylesterase
MSFVETSAGRVFYRERGSGAPIVLLHAVTHDHRDFDEVAETLAATHRVIAVDWPGHGRSDPVADPLASAVGFAQVLAEVVEGLQLPRAVFVGNSVGGYAAARLALDAPARAAGLVLVNSAGFIEQNLVTRALCRALGTPAIARRVLPRLVRGYMKPRNAFDQAVGERAAAFAGSAAGSRVAASVWRSFTAPEYDLRAQGPQLAGKVLLVWGARDTVLPMRAARQTREAIPDAPLHTFDTGHVVFASDPAGFLGVVEPFVERVLQTAP